MKVKSESKVAQSCPTLSDLMGCSLPGSSIHGIFQARVLEWAAIEIVQTFPKLLSLNVKCLSYREHVVGSCFYIQSYNFCPLIGKFNPFTFKIILILLDLRMPFCYVFWVAQLVKNPPAVTKTWVQSLGWEDPLEKGTATRSSILSSAQFSHSVMSNSLQPHGLQHVRLPCLSPISRAFSNSCPLKQ